MDLKVIYEDNHLLVVEKPVNVLSQSDNTGEIDMISLCKDYIKEKYNKPGNVFIGLVHRLDRPVGGVMIFARTSKAASRLSNQVRTRKISKSYRAVIVGKCEKSGDYVDYLFKDKSKNMVKVVDKNYKGGKEAKLSYRLLDSQYSDKIKMTLSLVNIDLHTGRSHQIRVQFSSRKNPLFGDQRYSKYAIVGQQIGLWSYKMQVDHPTTKERMTFISEPPDIYPWNIFK
ncbi:RluA family pseudouridine synthase [Peptostreptococcus equinus]|uniref:RNA pseudouridylate synthase n=1 Tax=Peptostreptococcus equinus TaxID=3003601 RepID=A0ABY7JNQ6_9FIRM|nr:RluA family pseudouridine synthase [Peptostreptococcus sp. CBA3647]WAW14996.1 RluA family pseudouridine synthase [Peptostreptococcus sp. CBA3647]